MARSPWAPIAAEARWGLEYELERLGVEFKNSRPYHPQTLGKVERLHQTLKRYLDAQAPAETLAELQGHLDAFRRY
jgi:transposase InsO family protein